MASPAQAFPAQAPPAGASPARLPPGQPAQARAPQAQAPQAQLSPARLSPARAPPARRPAGFAHAPMFPLGPDATPWREPPVEGVRAIAVEGRTVPRVAPAALSELAPQAFRDVSHLLRPAHLAQLRAILDDPEASPSDRFVALDLLKNANVAAGGVLPTCRGTGTATASGKKGQRVWVDGDEGEALAWGAHRTHAEPNLRYPQMAPPSMFEEVDTGNDLPAQFDIMAAPGEAHADEFHLMFVAKGGGSANKTFPFQETRAILSPGRLARFPEAKMRAPGASACPPCHLAVAIGGTSAELTLKAVKLASTKWLDGLPASGGRAGHAFRGLAMERQVLRIARATGIGAQFGGKYSTTAGRVDGYVAEFQAAGGSLVMLAKGNRPRAAREPCRARGGFYPGSAGGPAARLAQDCIRQVEALELPEPGMEAVWRIEVEGFPAFVVIDGKGSDFYDGLG